MISDQLGRAIQRTVNHAVLPGALPPDARDARAMSRVGTAARAYALARPDAKSFCHCGKRLRLYRFDGWLIVTTWSGVPIVGPIRIYPLARWLG